MSPSHAITEYLLLRAQADDPEALDAIHRWLRPQLESSIRESAADVSNNILNKLLIKIARLLAKPQQHNPVNRRQLVGLAYWLLRQATPDVFARIRAVLSPLVELLTTRFSMLEAMPAGGNDRAN